MSSFNNSVFASMITHAGFKEIERSKYNRRFELHSAEGMKIAAMALTDNGVSTMSFLQQEYEWNIKAARMLDNSLDFDFGPSYQRWIKFHIQEAIKAHGIAFSILRHISRMYEKTIYRVVSKLDVDRPAVDIMTTDNEFCIQTYSVSVDDQHMTVFAHIAGRATRYDSIIEEDLEFVKLTEWLSTQHKSGFGYLHLPINRTVDGRKYHIYRTQDAARNLPMYRDAKSVKIIRETLVTKFEGDDVFDLIGEIDTGKTTYEFIAYEIGVVI